MFSSKNKPFIDLKVWLGTKNEVQAVIDKDIYLTVPKRKKSTIEAVIEYNGPLEAPIKKGDHVHVHNVKTKKW